LDRAAIIQQILPANRQPQDQGAAFAPANIALCKYWGKRDEDLNLPLTDSLSVSLGTLGAKTVIRPAARDRFQLNGTVLAANDPAFIRLFSFLNDFRPNPEFAFDIESESSIPVAAGLASSASGFAALVGALNELFNWQLKEHELSILARMGSGSACRSVRPGFMHWTAGTRADGLDSYAQPVQADWPDFRIALQIISNAPKPIGSRPAMRRTRETSILYERWPEKVSHDLEELLAALNERDIDRLGRTAESNALAMHATMIDSWPPILYWTPESVQYMQRIWSLRRQGLPVFFTMDAGPNLKLLFTAEYEKSIREEFPDAIIVNPFIESLL
jgi:diphosphomevalonate decarboxylase